MSTDECDSSVIDKRTIKDFSPSVLQAIRSMTASMETLPVGTYKYRIFEYPSDIDIFETLETCCTFNLAKVKAAFIIQDIVRKVLANPNMIFSDFKAGYDERFHIYTGTVGDKIVDYNGLYIKRDINNLFEANLLTQEQCQHLLSLVKDNATFEDVIELNEALRKYWVVRWNPEEILNGYKILPGNYKLFLDVALAQGSVVKLDAIYKLISDDPTASRYVEMTNFFMIKQLDRRGNEITLTEELGNYAQSLLEDVYKYYDKNTLKSIKRLWMYLNLMGDICDLSLFTPLFQSEIAQDAQIIGDIEVAINLLDNKVQYDKPFLFNTLAQRLKLLQGRCVNEVKLKQPESTDHTVIQENLSALKDCLANSVNQRTKQWLALNNIDIFDLIQT